VCFMNLAQLQWFHFQLRAAPIRAFGRSWGGLKKPLELRGVSKRADIWSTECKSSSEASSNGLAIPEKK
jgi:hypothetical protein